MVKRAASDIGTVLTIRTPFGARTARVVEKPFYDPKKKLTTG